MDSTPLIEPVELPPSLRLARVILVPILIVVLMPFVLLVIVAIYVIATLEGTRMAYQAATGTTPAADLELPRPHFLELREQIERKSQVGSEK